MLQSIDKSKLAKIRIRKNSRHAFGIEFYPRSEKDLLAEASGPLSEGEGVKLVVTANTDHISNLYRNKDFRAAYDSAWLVTVDGMPVYIYAKLCGVSIEERITGADVFPKLLDALDSNHRAFFVCSNQATAKGIASQMRARGFPDNTFGFAIPPFGFERQAALTSDLIRAIKDNNTTHLFMGIGAPKSEVWIHQNRPSLGTLYAFCFGAALEFTAGTKLRAPKIFRALGMEWLWRLASEPKRLYRRYLVSSWGFASAVIKDLRRA
jgi:bacterial polymer biosynthesis proteins, WecB/TagA/CpsF family